MKFTHTTHVTFDLCDPAGILFFANYFTLTLRGLEAFTRDKGIWEEWFSIQSYGVPIRHAEADYLRPLLSGAECRLELEVKKIGNSSVELETSLWHKNDLCAKVNTSHVFVDLKTRQKTPIPAKIRQVLETAMA